jgi:hypothetical protein
MADMEWRNLIFFAGAWVAFELIRAALYERRFSVRLLLALTTAVAVAAYAIGIGHQSP